MGETQILTVLSAIGKVETRVGELYGWLSDVFADDVEASGFFFRMCMQEKSHASLVSFCMKMVRRSPSDFHTVDVDIDKATELIEAVDTFREDHSRPGLEEALLFAMEVESHGAESIHRSAIIQSNPEVAGVINSLAKADSEHYEKLKAFAAERGILV